MREHAGTGLSYGPGAFVLIKATTHPAIQFVGMSFSQGI